MTLRWEFFLKFNREGWWGGGATVLVLGESVCGERSEGEWEGDGVRSNVTDLNKYGEGPGEFWAL